MKYIKKREREKERKKNNNNKLKKKIIKTENEIITKRKIIRYNKNK